MNVLRALADAINNAMPVNQNVLLGDLVKAANEGKFYRTVTIKSASAATPVVLIADTEVDQVLGSGRKIYVEGFFFDVSGATAWTDTTATKVTLQDTAGVSAASIAKAALTANAIITPATSGVTLGTPMSQGAGLTVSKGLEVIGDANFAAGSDLICTVFGQIF